MDFDFVSLQQRPPDGGKVAEVTLDLFLQVECPEVKIKTNIKIKVQIKTKIGIDMKIDINTY